jgi:hypothetical protein
MATHTVEDPQRYFFLHGGGELTSLEDLFVELQAMEPHVWQHHVTEERNDFATWVRDVMGDRTLAHKMQNVTTKDDLLKLLFIQFFR